MDSLQVLKALTIDELEKVFAIRQTVFVEEQNSLPALEWEYEDASTHFLALADHQPCGTCRWRKTKWGYKLERFAVLKEFRGAGVGRAIIATVLADLPNDAHFVYLNAQLTAKPLYNKFGFVAEGAEFEEAGIPHVRMVKAL